MSTLLRGSINNAASLATSFIAEVLEVITGVPQAIDSITGKPNPSHSEGNTNIVAALYIPGKSLSGTTPNQSMLLFSLILDKTHLKSLLLFEKISKAPMRFSIFFLGFNEPTARK